MVIGGDGLIGCSISEAIIQNGGIAIVASRKDKPTVFQHLDDEPSQHLKFLQTDVTDESSVCWGRTGIA